MSLGPASLRRVAAWLGAGAALGLTFALYLRPDLMFALATQFWACF